MYEYKEISPPQTGREKKISGQFKYVNFWWHR